MRRVLISLVGIGFGAIVLSVLVILLIPAQWLTDQVERIASETSGYQVSVGSVDLHVITANPSVTLTDIAIDGIELPGLAKARQFTAAISLPALLKGQILVDRIDLQEAVVDLQRDAEAKTTWASASSDGSEEPAQSVALPMIRTLRITDSRLKYQDQNGNQQAVLAIEANGSNVPDSPPVTIDIGGEINGADASATFEFESTNGALNAESSIDLKVDATVGEVNASLDGRIENPRQLKGVDLSLSVQADQVAKLEQLQQINLPDMTPLAFSGSLITEKDEFVVRRFDLTSANSSVQGDVRVSPDTQPITVYANLIANTFDVDEIFDRVGRYSKTSTHQHGSKRPGDEQEASENSSSERSTAL